MNKDAVKRIQKTRPQKVLGSRDRIRNLKGAFGVTKSWIPKKCVLVIDDIIQPEYHTQSGKGVEKCRSTKSIIFDHKHWTRTLTV